MNAARRVFVVMLALVVVLCFLPPAASVEAALGSWADVADTQWFIDQTAAGQGTAANPFVITTAEQLAGLASLTNAGNTFGGKYIRLDADLDLGGRSWVPIGSNSCRFSGDFDGNGHTIRNLTYYASDWADFGLFGWLSAYWGQVSIRDLGLVHVNIGGLVTSCGGLVAFLGVDGYGSSASITGCFVTGSIHSDANTGTLGGLVGRAMLVNSSYTTLTISDCYTACDIALTSANDESWYTRYAGGLIGELDNFGGTELYANISDSYSASRVKSANLARSRLGAFAGWVGTPDGITMADCLFDYQAAGLSYAFDSTSSIFSVTGVRTTQMTGAGALPAGWDVATWQAVADLYPQLQVFSGVPDASLASALPIYLYENATIPELSDTSMAVRHSFTVPVMAGVTWSSASEAILTVSNVTGAVMFTSPASDTDVTLTAATASGISKDFVVLCKSGVDPSDVTAPTVAFASITPADFSATIEVTSDEPADLYVLLKPAAEAAPSVGDIVRDSGTEMRAGTAATISYGALDHSTDYTAYVLGVDPTGNVSDVVGENFTTLLDQTPPACIGYSPALISGTILDFTVGYNESGTVKYVIQPSNLAAPSNQQVANGLNADGEAAFYYGSGDYVAYEWPTYYVDISSFGPAAYRIYVVCEDAYGNVSSVLTLSFTVKSTANDIVSFAVDGQTGPSTIDAGSHTVAFHMPYGSDVTALTPTITVSDAATVSPASGAAVDFTGPATYTVTAEDGSAQDWTVTCVVDPNTANDITGFTVTGQVGDSVIDMAGHTVTFHMPYGSDVTALTPAVAVSDQATVSPLSGAAADFSAGPVTYTVIAGDSSAQDWTVTCVVDPKKYYGGGGGDSTPPAPPVPPAPTFSDVPSSYWAYDAIESLSSKGIVSGYPDGTFGPEATITRAEFATMLVRALGLNAAGTSGRFADATANAWYYDYVNAASLAGLVDGVGDGLFAPDGLITREQMAVMVARGLRDRAPAVDGTELDAFSDRSAVSGWAVSGMAIALKAGIVSGMTADTLAPQENATRAQAVMMIYRMLVILGE